MMNNPVIKFVSEGSKECIILGDNLKNKINDSQPDDSSAFEPEKIGGRWDQYLLRQIFKEEAFLITSLTIEGYRTVVKMPKCPN